MAVNHHSTGEFGTCGLFISGVAMTCVASVVDAAMSASATVDVALLSDGMSACDGILASIGTSALSSDDKASFATWITSVSSA